MGFRQTLATTSHALKRHTGRWREMCLYPFRGECSYEAAIKSIRDSSGEFTGRQFGTHFAMVGGS